MQILSLFLDICNRTNIFVCIHGGLNEIDDKNLYDKQMVNKIINADCAPNDIKFIF